MVVIFKANKQVFLDYDVSMIDSLTISGLSMKILLTQYYNNNKPSILQQSMYNNIKEGYFGGITEVYKPYGENLYYYDVNSLYPYVALQDLPGLECYFTDYHLTQQLIGNLFGFCYCLVEAPKDSYLGLLPVKDKSGLLFPVGKWYAWYFSEQLKFAEANGYKIRVVKGYNFSRTKYVLKHTEIKYIKLRQPRQMQPKRL